MICRISRRALELLAAVAGSRPRRNSTFGASWVNRSITPRQPKSGEQLAQMAPMLVVASIAMTVCGMFGMQDTTRSPGPTPIARSRVARMRTWPASCFPGHAGQRGGLAAVQQRVHARAARLRSTCSA